MAQAQIRTAQIKDYVAGSPGSGGGSYQFNVKDYGAVGDGVTDDTAAIQAAHDAAIAGAYNANGTWNSSTLAGTLYFPKGRYRISQLVWNPWVALVGENRMNTVITANSSLPLFVHKTGVDNGPWVQISNLFIRGNNTSTIGFDLRYSAFFNVRMCKFDGFVNQTFKWNGLLMGKFTSCIFANADPFRTQTHILARNGTGDYGAMHANFVKFDDCTFQGASLNAIDWAGGSGLYLDHCNFERTGTGTTAGTGAVKFVPDNETGHGLRMTNCWGEVNKGNYVVEISGNADKQVHHMIDFSTFVYFLSTVGTAVIVRGNNTLVLDTNTFAESSGDFLYDVKVDGPNAKCIIRGGDYGASMSTGTNAGGNPLAKVLKLTSAGGGKFYEEPVTEITTGVILT